MAVNWMTWRESPWLARDFAHTTLVQLCDRLDAIVISARSSAEFLERALPQVAVELNGDWAAIVERTPKWKAIASSSPVTAEDLPGQ